MNLEDSILQAIDIIINQKLKDLKFDYSVIGKITVVNGDGTYNVQINDTVETLKARAGLTLTVGKVVYVRVPNGNSSYKFIDCIRP